MEDDDPINHTSLHERGSQIRATLQQGRARAPSIEGLGQLSRVLTHVKAEIEHPLPMPIRHGLLDSTL
jgi:hypothetical protein